MNEMVNKPADKQRFCDARDSRRSIARPIDRRNHAADLRDVDVRAAEPRRTQGARLRPIAQPDALGARTLCGRSGKRRTGVCVRIGHGGDCHRARVSRQRGAHRCRRRPLWRHVSIVRAGAQTQCRARIHVCRHVESRSVDRRAAARDKNGVGRNAEQPAAQAGGSSQRSRKFAEHATSSLPPTIRSRVPGCSVRSSSASTWSCIQRRST